jgi:predicted DNA-binding transcriptional regulator AlpA
MTGSSPQPVAVSKAELADKLQISPDSIERWEYQKVEGFQIRSIRIGRRVLYSNSDLLRVFRRSSTAHACLVTIPQAAKMMSISRATMFRLTRNKMVRTITVGDGSVRISPSDLEAMFDRQTKYPTI